MSLKVSPTNSGSAASTDKAQHTKASTGNKTAEIPSSYKDGFDASKTSAPAATATPPSFLDRVIGFFKKVADTVTQVVSKISDVASQAGGFLKKLFGVVKEWVLPILSVIPGAGLWASAIGKVVDFGSSILNKLGIGDEGTAPTTPVSDAAIKAEQLRQQQIQQQQLEQQQRDQFEPAA